MDILEEVKKMIRWRVHSYKVYLENSWPTSSFENFVKQRMDILEAFKSSQIENEIGRLIRMMEDNVITNMRVGPVGFRKDALE